MKKVKGMIACVIAAEVTEAAKLKAARGAEKSRKDGDDEVIVPKTSDDESESESESEDEALETEDMCAGMFKGCVSKKLVTSEAFLSEVRVFTKGGAMSMANITNQEMLSSKAKQLADRELMRLSEACPCQCGCAVGVVG